MLLPLKTCKKCPSDHCGVTLLNKPSWWLSSNHRTAKAQPSCSLFSSFPTTLPHSFQVLTVPEITFLPYSFALVILLTADTFPQSPTWLASSLQVSVTVTFWETPLPITLSLIAQGPLTCSPLPPNTLYCYSIFPKYHHRHTLLLFLVIYFLSTHTIP